MSNKLQILIVCHEATIHGGANQSLLDWLSDNSDSSVSYTVLIPNEFSHCVEFEKALDSISVNHIRVPFIRETFVDRENGSILNRLKYKFSRLIRVFFLNICEDYCIRFAIKKYQLHFYDAVLTNSLATCFGYNLSHALSIPHVWHVRENLASMDLYYPCSFDLKKASSESAAIYISEAIEDDYKEVLPFYKSIVLHDRIYFPKPFEKEPFMSDDCCHIMSVGTLSTRKRHNIVIKAVAQLIAQGYKIKLDIFGDGTEFDSLNALINSLGLSENVHLRGYVSDLRFERSRTDIAVTASENESLGRVSLEAMYYHNLLIASNSGFNPYLVGRNERGLLFSLDNFDELAERISWAINHVDEVNTKLELGFDFAKSFSQPIKSRVNNFFYSILDEN